MKLQSFFPCEYGFLLKTDEGTCLRVEAWSPRILRLTYVKGEMPDRTPSGDLVIASPKGNGMTVAETDTAVVFSAGEAALSVRRATFALRFLRNGKAICALSPAGMRLIDTTITKPVWVTDPGDGKKLKHIRTEERHGYRFRIAFDFGRDEKIYGLGQDCSGVLDRRQTVSYLHQQNNKAPVPAFVSSLGYGVFVNTEAFSGFLRDDTGTVFSTDPVEAGDWFFLAAEKPDDAVADLRFLTGNVPMMPKWLFGYAQSKERYCTQDEVIAVLKEYRRRKVPLDLIVQDWNYWLPGTWSDKSFDPSRYPDPTGMCDEIHRNHAHVMISVWPNTAGGGDCRELAEKNQFLAFDSTFGGGGTLNVFDPEARKTYWNQLNRGIFRHGFDAWWCDSSEPFEPEYGSFDEPDRIKEKTLAVCKKWMDSSRVNVYSLLHSMGVYEHQRKETEKKRVVNLTRSSYIGQQRYSGIVWSGDIGGSFEELRRQIAEGLSYSISGLPYWTVDIGGFFPTHGSAKYCAHVPYRSGRDPGYRELYARWIQFGCFLPVMRSHGTGFPREIWNFGEEGEPFYDSIKKSIELRYRLMPYIYSVAWQVTKNAFSFLRPLVFDFASDPEALAQGSDSYLFGPSLLVSPVTEPMYYEGADAPLADVPRTKEVYLPAGTYWYDYRSEECFSGGQTVTVDTPIDVIPLFVRAGSVLPTAEVMQYADEKKDAPYFITVYPGADGAFTLYEDEGDNYNYESGAYAEVDFLWNDKACTLTVSDRRGSFEGMCVRRKLNIRVVGGGSVSVDYDGRAQTLAFETKEVP